MQLRYSFRLYPTPSQQMMLSRTFGCVRTVFNDALRARQDAFRNGLPFISDGDLDRLVVTSAKRTPERAWLAEVSTVPLQQAVRQLTAAYRNFFNSVNGSRKGAKVAPPRFRSRKDHRQTAQFTRNGFRLRKNETLYLAKIGEIPVRWSRNLPSDPSSVTVIKDAAGRYFASFVIDTEPDPLAEVDREVGVDLGLTHFAVLSDGTKISSPKFLRRAEKKLKKAQKELSRKAKGSNNRKKAVHQVARVHAEVADKRRDFHHKLSTQLIRDNQAIYVEDLCVKGLARTRLAKSIHDAGWTAFVNMLIYKADLYRRTVVKIGRFEPTSQTCSTCGHRDGPKPLHIRTWTCKGCGSEHDRDINAALNILAAGQAESINACGDQVRRPVKGAQVGETGTQLKTPHSIGRVGQGIPRLKAGEDVNIPPWCRL